MQHQTRTAHVGLWFWAVTLFGGMAAGDQGPSMVGTGTVRGLGNSASERPVDVQRRLDTVLKRTAAEMGPMAAMIMVDGAVVYDTGVLGADSGTLFEAASCSKWLVAAVIMALVDEGRLDLEDAVHRYISSFDGPKSEITVRQLLTHTSGLPRRMKPSWPREASLEKAADYFGTAVRLTSAPGARFCYGNLSYLVAARVAEVVAGMPWHRLFQERIATPCGMTVAHFPAAGLGRGINQAKTSLPDYLRFLQMIRNEGVSVTGDRVLSREAVREMTRDQTARVEMRCFDKRTHKKMARTSYGLGLWRERVDPVTGAPEAVSHFGTSGFRAIVNYRHNYVAAIGFKRKPAEKKRRWTQRYLRALPLITHLAYTE